MTPEELSRLCPLIVSLAEELDESVESVLAALESDRLITSAESQSIFNYIEEES